MKNVLLVLTLFCVTNLSFAQVGGINIENQTGLDIHIGVQFTNSPCWPSSPDDINFDLDDGDNMTVTIAAALQLFRVGVIYSGSNYTLYSPCLPGCGDSIPAGLPFSVSWDSNATCRWFKLILY